MNNSKSHPTYKIEKTENEFLITSEKGNLTTPKGLPVSGKNEQLLKLIIKDLAVNVNVDPTVFGYYSLFCTYREFFQDRKSPFSKDDFREIVKSDITLNTTAGPEKVDQLNCWSALTDLLEKEKIQHPIFGWNPGFDNVVNHFYKLFDSLTAAQRTCAVNSAGVHGSMIYGVILATGKCTEKEYAIAIAAGNYIIHGVFSDVRKAGYNSTIKIISNEAKVLTAFVKLVDYK